MNQPKPPTPFPPAAVEPVCQVCRTPLLRRPRAAMSEQTAWCGTWYDHPPVSPDECGARVGVLIPSPGLVAFLDEQRRTAAARTA